MSEDVFWAGLLLAPLAAVPTLELLRRRPQDARVVSRSCAVVLVLFAVKLALALRLKNTLIDDLGPGLAFAALCAIAACGRSRAGAKGCLFALALIFVVFAYVIVLATFSLFQLLPSHKPTVSELSPGLVCETSHWAIPGDGGTSADLYEVLPYVPFLMRLVDGGSASDYDGGFSCKDALASYKARHSAPRAR